MGGDWALDSKVDPFASRAIPAKTGYKRYHPSCRKHLKLSRWYGTGHGWPAWRRGMARGGHEPFSSLPRYNLSIETPTRHCTLVCGTRLTMFQRFLYLESQCPDKCTHIQNDLCAMRKCYCTSATCCRDKIGSIEPGIPGHSSHSPHPRTIKSSQTFTWPPFSYKEHPQKKKHILGWLCIMTYI